MMTSSGSGAYRVGGLGSLSSSSNLSPLAAPFRVEKSLQKHNSTNTSVTYPDVPMYSPYFDPAVQPWNHSSLSATGSQFTEAKSMGINNTCIPPPAVYEYSGSQPSVSVADVYHVPSGSAAAYDPFSYDPFPNPLSTASEEGVKSYYSSYVSAPAQKDPLSTASEEGVKSYYPPYVSAPPQKDGYLSLGVSNGHNFDMLSNSSTAHLGSCGSSVSDHLQGRPADGDNKRNWGSFWSGVNGQEKWLGYAQGFGPKVSSQSDFPNRKSPFPVGEIGKSQSSIVVHTQPFVDGGGDNIPDGANKSNSKQDGCFDIFGGAYCLGSLGIDQPDSRSLLDCSRLPASFSSWRPKETSHFLDPVVQSATNFCGSQKANGSSLGNHFGQNNFYVFGSTSATSTFPVTIDKSSYGESGSSAEVTFSALKANPEVSVETNQSNISARHEYSYPVEPNMPLGLKRQSRIVIRRPPPSSVLPSSSSSQTRESFDSRIGRKDVSDKGQVSPQMSHHLSPNGLDLKVNDSQAAHSVEKLSWGSDVHNPAEDSPCWRGASSNRFSPFAVPEDMAAQEGFTQKFDEWKSQNTQVSQIKSCLVETSDFRDFFSEKVEEGVARPSVPESLSKDNEERGYTIPQPFCFDLNARDGLQFADGSFASTKECCPLNKSETNLLPGIALDTKQVSGGSEIPSVGQTSEAVASEGIGKFPSVLANGSFDVPSSSENNQSSSPTGDTASLKHCQATSNISDANIDVNVLLKAMTNLSEIFRGYCSSKQVSVPEQHSIAIKRIVANLNASMLMMAGGISSTMPSSGVNSSKIDLSDVQMVNNAAYEALAAAVKLGGTTEGLLDSVSCMDNPYTNGDGNVTESLKKILNEDFPVEEDMDQQKLLYKNLWLDAEASLCAMTAKARLLRVKAEMERTHDGTKDGEIPLSSDNSGDVHGTVELAADRKDSSALSDCQKSHATSKSNHREVPEVNKCHVPNTQAVTTKPAESEGQIHFPSLHASKRDHTGNDSDGSGSTGHKNSVDASVMARYQILKSRIESTEGPSQENKESSVGHNEPSSLYTSNDSIGAENPVSAKYQTLSCRVDHESLNNDRDSPPGDDNYLPDRESSSPVYQILKSGADITDSLYVGGDSPNSQLLSNSVGVSEVGEDSIIARFRILQSRINYPETVNKDQTFESSVKALEESTDKMSFLEMQNNVLRCAFGPYPEFIEDEDEDVNQFDVNAHDEAYMNQYCKPNMLNGEIFEGWYATDIGSSDWEHV